MFLGRCAELLNSYGTHLVFRRTADIVECRFGEPVAVAVLKMEGHPAFADIGFVGHMSDRINSAAS